MPLPQPMGSFGARSPLPSGMIRRNAGSETSSEPIPGHPPAAEHAVQGIREYAGPIALKEPVADPGERIGEHRREQRDPRAALQGRDHERSEPAHVPDDVEPAVHGMVMHPEVDRVKRGEAVLDHGKLVWVGLNVRHLRRVR